MADQMLVSCFTDLKDSTRLTQGLGQNSYFPYLDDHFSITQTLTELAGGEYVKNTGDGNMVLFKSGEQAINFALHLQEFYAEQPCLIRPPLKFGIGLCLGQVERTETDVFGSGANQAARVQSKAGAGHIVINTPLFESLKRQWGAPKAGKYFTSIGQHEMKGVSDPPTQELFSFEWRDFRRDNPDCGLVNLVYEHLQRASVEPFNLGVLDLANPGIIIWPVVPRNLATAIHRGQAEIIRLLALLGWTVKLLIADCGTENSERTYSEAFFSSIKRYMEARGIKNIDIMYMSCLYQPSYTKYEQIQDIFRRVSLELSLAALLEINDKKYDREERERIRNSSTLKFLRPVLSAAAVLHLAEQAGQKCIIIGGADEETQWKRTIDVRGTRPHLGILMNPILTGLRGQGMQKDNWPIWESYQSLMREMESTNLAAWTFRLHAYLPAFPETSIEIDGKRISPQEWGNEMGIPEKLQKESLARHVWKYLAPTL